MKVWHGALLIGGVLVYLQIVGAVKSLESLGDLISSTLKTVKKWQLTEV